MIIKKAEKAKKSKESSKTPKGRVPEKKKNVFFIGLFARPESWEKEGQNQRTKKLNFGMGPNVKFVSPICDLISERKNGGKFSYP